MRVPYPERFKWGWATAFIVVLLVCQLAEGSDPAFCLLISLYTALTVAAFNAAGGMQYPSGAFVLFTGVLVVLFGMTFKVFTGEAAESHLQAPLRTAFIYCVCMGCMYFAAVGAKRFRSKRGFAVDIDADDTMMKSAIACFFIGTVLQVIFGSEFASQATIGSAIRQVNKFPQLSVLLATTYVVKSSNGRKGFNWINTMGIIWLFGWGVIYASKELMFVGPVTWLFAAWAYGFNFTRTKLIVAGFCIFFLVYYMVPYSQYVRNFRDEGGSREANQAVALEYIFKLNDVRALNIDNADAMEYENAPHLYKSEHGLADRLSMFAYDDALVERTDEGHVFGLYPTWHAILNTVPHLIWKNKPQFASANEYGRELQVISPEDYTTGISFSPAADAYHQAEWYGVLVLYPIVIFIYFLFYDSLVGSVRRSPWPLLPIGLNAHLAPEGLIDGLILQLTYGTMGFLIVAWTVRYIFPAFVRVVTGGERTIVRKTIDFKLGSRPLSLPVPAIGPNVPRTP